MIPYGRQLIDAADVAAVTDALTSPMITQGPHLAQFEEGLCEFTGAQYAVAFSSGTAALHAAVAVAGIGAGDTVVTSPLSFAASANCARYAGATPTFVDIDPSTLNMEPTLLGPHIDAVVAVHYAGLPLDVSKLRHRPRVVIEDAAHAIGAVTAYGPVGNCTRSDMCAFSFHPVKTITTGEGGAVTTNSATYAERLRRFRNHGIKHRADADGWFYEIESLGFNYRMTDLQAALGTSQLSKIRGFVERRNELAERYRNVLSELPIELPPRAPEGWLHAYHLFPIQVARRRHVYNAMRAAGIGVQVHYIPIYHHPLYQDLNIKESDFPCTEHVYSRLLSLPMYPALTEEEQDRVVSTLRESL